MSHTPTFTDEPTFAPESQDKRWPGKLDYYRTDVVRALDWLGKPFKVGDRVAYCIGAGRGQMMALGVVQAIRVARGFTWVDSESGEWRDRKRVELPWEEGSVEVQVLTDTTSGGWDNEKRVRPAWVNPMNITALPLAKTSKRKVPKR